jgi:hypothetical protein
MPSSGKEILPRRRTMRGNYRTDITFVAGAVALAVFMVACNKQEKRETIKAPTASEKIQAIVTQMSGGKYNPFLEANRALADRVAGATLNMMIVDKTTGERTNLIDSGKVDVTTAATPPDIIEPTVQVAAAATPPDIIDPLMPAAKATPPDIIEPTIAIGAERPKVEEKIETETKAVKCADGKKCLRLKRLSDGIMEKLADPTKYELQIEVLYILKNPNTIVSA